MSPLSNCVQFLLQKLLQEQQVNLPQTRSSGNCFRSRPLYSCGFPSHLAHYECACDVPNEYGILYFPRAEFSPLEFSSLPPKKKGEEKNLSLLWENFTLILLGAITWCKTSKATGTLLGILFLLFHTGVPFSLTAFPHPTASYKKRKEKKLQKQSRTKAVLHTTSFRLTLLSWKSFKAMHKAPFIYFFSWLILCRSRKL